MRTINRIIIHSTATPAGRAVTVAEITGWHRQRGFNTIGYHFLVGLNGEVCIGRNIATAGAHVVGHNADSIGIAYVGGTDINGKPLDTRTDAQKKALKDLILKLQCDYPNATVHGHRDFAATACPSFNVATEL